VTGLLPVVPLAGLQLLGSADAEACVDGFCAVPGTAAEATETASQDPAS